MKKRFRWDKTYLYWGITAFCVIAACILVFLGLSYWRSIRGALKILLSILMPFVYGLAIAYLLNKPVNFFETKVFRFIKKKNPARGKRRRRILSVLVTFVLLFFMLGGALALILPQLYSSIERLVNSLPHYFAIAMDWIGGLLNGNPQLESIVLDIVGNVEESLTGWLRTTILAQAGIILAGLTTGVIGFVREIVNFTIGFVIAAYTLYHKERFALQIKKTIYAIWHPKWAGRLLDGFKFIDRTCGSFISSKLLDSLIVGIVCWIAMSIAQIPYALLISLIVGVTNIIPFFGPFIGAIPSALLILIESPMKCLIFIIIILIIQQLDGNVLFPRLQGSALKLSGFWILFAILFFGGIFGFWGMLLGVPIFYTIYHGATILIHSRLRERGLSTETDAYAGDVAAHDCPPGSIGKPAPDEDGDMPQ